jgi:hypothetical protein
VITSDYITEWRARAPWVQDFQVEQDLVICLYRGTVMRQRTAPVIPPI